MKKITLLFFLLAASLGFSQPTTDAPTPTNDAADVISIYSDAYTDVATNYNPNWGQSGLCCVNTTYDPTGGGTNFVLEYANFNYQGTELTTQNAAGMEFLHVDLWTNADPGATDIQVSPINNGTGTGETLVSITYTSGTWTSVDIPKSAFTGMTWDSVFQMKFAANGPGSTVPVDIYLDNVYFWKAPIAPGSDATLSDLQVDSSTIGGFSPNTFSYTYGVPTGSAVVPQITTATPTDPAVTSVTITQATAVPGDATVVVVSQNGSVTETYTVSYVFEGPGVAAPTPPNRAPADVISLFSDAYSDVNVTEWSTTWDDSSIEDVMVDGNATKKVTFTNFLGVEFDNFDATSMTHFHIDIYTDETDLVGKVFNPKWSDHGGVGSEQSAFILTYTTFTTGTWISIDVPLTDFSGDLTRSDLSQFVVTSNLPVVYFDNLYLHNNTVLSTDDFETTQFSVYPNPSNNVWNVKTNNQIVKTVQVFDVLGKQVISLNPNSEEVTIDASTLPSGLYFAKLATETGSDSIKLIKN